MSARVNTFRSAGQVVRTIAVFTPVQGASQTLSLTGDPERVSFDPSLARTARDFMVRGFRALVEHSEWLLFLACLVTRPARELAHRSLGDGGAIAAFLAGQSIAMIAGAAWSAAPADVRVGLELTAASAVVVAALGISRAPRVAVPLALGFARSPDSCWGRRFAMPRCSPLARARRVRGVRRRRHRGAGVGRFGGVGGRRLRRPPGPSRADRTIVTAVVVAHTAIHDMVDRGDLLAQSGAMTVEHMLALLTVGWAMLILGVGACSREPIR